MEVENQKNQDPNKLEIKIFKHSNWREVCDLEFRHYLVLGSWFLDL